MNSTNVPFQEVEYGKKFGTPVNARRRRLEDNESASDKSDNVSSSDDEDLYAVESPPEADEEDLYAVESPPEPPVEERLSSVLPNSKTKVVFKTLKILPRDKPKNAFETLTILPPRDPLTHECRRKPEPKVIKITPCRPPDVFLKKGATVKMRKIDAKKVQVVREDKLEMRGSVSDPQVEKKMHYWVKDPVTKKLYKTKRLSQYEFGSGSQAELLKPRGDSKEMAVKNFFGID